MQPGDVVLDLGSGTGVLSFFACDAGARRVYAVEREHLADMVAMFARQFGYGDRITVVHGNSKDVELPERANVLVTETIGSVVFNEGFLGTVIDARRRLLAPDARLIPSALDVWITPIEFPSFHEPVIQWWRTPRHGFDMSSIATFAANTAYSAKVPPDALLAEPATMLSLRMEDLDDTAQHGAAELRTTRDGVVHGFAVGFTATLAEGITLTNLWSGGTWWDQGVLPLEFPVTAAAGTPVSIDVRTDDGRMWHWRGRVGDTAFAQTTLLSRPPCVAVE